MTNLRTITIVCLLMGALACGQADKVPANVLSKEKMRDVLIDMNMADSYSYDISPLRGVPLPDSVRQQKVKVFYRQILDLHHLSVKEFMASWKYYEAHPNRLKEVYDMMQAEIARQRTVLDGQEKLKQYAEDPSMFFPYPKSTVLSKKQDTILPFLKRKIPNPNNTVTSKKQDTILPLLKGKKVNPVKTPKHE